MKKKSEKIPDEDEWQETKREEIFRWLMGLSELMWNKNLYGGLKLYFFSLIAAVFIKFVGASHLRLISRLFTSLYTFLRFPHAITLVRKFLIFPSTFFFTPLNGMFNEMIVVSRRIIINITKLSWNFITPLSTENQSQAELDFKPYCTNPETWMKRT